MMAAKKKFTENDGIDEKTKYYYFDIKVNGRVLYNVKDCMYLNLHLKDYDLDRVAFELLQKREPKYSHDTLTQ